MGKHKLAACGIDCNECGQYKVTHFGDKKSAEDLVPWFKSMGWIGKDDGAEAVIKKAPLCGGCWSGVGFCSQNCMRPCCVERKLNNCGECVDFPCEKYVDWIADLDHHKKAMEHLTAIHNEIFLVTGDFT